MEQASVVIADIKGWEQEYLARQLPEEWQAVTTEESAEDLSPEVLGRAEVLSVFIGSHVDRALLARAPALRLVVTRSTGFDHVDVAVCAERGIAVANVPQYGENTVAEHCFGLILALSRNIYDAVDRVKRGHLSIEGLLGFDLYGKTLGVVGAGSIGLHVIRIGRALNMRVIAFDVAPHELMAQVLGFEYLSLEEVLGQADVLSLHVPLNPHTRHLINAERLDLMKPGAILVNTSRGAVVDSSALLERLDDGRLAGAALDVLEGEQVITEDRMLLQEEGSGAVERLRLAVEAYQLMHHPRVLVTPHMAFYSREALQRILLTTVENIRSFLAGTPQNLVRAPEGATAGA